MRQRVVLTVGTVCLLLLSASVLSAQIRGDYVETRSADVWTGPCFANGEVNLTGTEATIAWKIREGEWNGTRLDGLNVVAVTRANATIGDPYKNPYPAHAILLLDQRATETQKQALVAFAKAMGGRLLENVVQVQSVPITMEVGQGSRHGVVNLQAGSLAKVETRLLGDHDHLCGNEYVYYPPLTELSHAMPAVAVANEYLGNQLGAEWKIFDKRSAFVGTFEH
jgi:hypothetical protein